jgi:hypothetical protein
LSKRWWEIVLIQARTTTLIMKHLSNDDPESQKGAVVVKRSADKLKNKTIKKNKNAFEPKKNASARRKRKQNKNLREDGAKKRSWPVVLLEALELCLLAVQSSEVVLYLE